MAKSHWAVSCVWVSDSRSDPEALGGTMASRTRSSCLPTWLRAPGSPIRLVSDGGVHVRAGGWVGEGGGVVSSS